VFRISADRIAVPYNRVFLIGLFAVLISADVQACPVCFVTPTKTVADHLMESELVVLARENPERPFTYSVVTVLKGESPTGPFGLFVNSTTRRRLKLNPGEAVVLVRNGKDRSWQSLGIANKQYQEVVKRILLFADRWSKEGAAHERHEFFLSLFGHKNRAIFELAYLELSRAPYGTIKQMAEFISRDDLRPLLERREYIQWRPLAILLLAQKADQRDRRFIETSFQSCQRFSLTTNLAAWTTAYIELNGTRAVEEIEATYLRDSERSHAEIRAVLTALSVHGRSGRVELCERIVKSYGVALQFHPKAAGSMTSDLIQWRQWKYKEVVAELLINEKLTFQTSDVKVMRRYVAMAVPRTSN